MSTASGAPRFDARAVLFDLDGTFADTAPDMAAALNKVRASEDLAPLPLAMVRPHVSRGARGMIDVGFGFGAEHPRFGELRDEFLNVYERSICVDSRVFEGIGALLDALATRGVVWGIVTNKASRFALPLLRALDMDQAAKCIVCGDTTAFTKPHPEPLLHAARVLELDPARCIYVGDDRRDTEAAIAAGMPSLAARYGYLGVGSDPRTWGADGMIDAPEQVLAYL